MTRGSLPKAGMLSRVVLTLLLLLQKKAWSYKLCSPAKGGGICPDHSTCCPTQTPGLSACISAKPGEVGTCCSDDNGSGVTGCPSGYECLSSLPTTTSLRRSNPNNTTTTTSSQNDLYCHRTDPNYNGTKPKPVHLPRYKLCTLPRSVMTQVYGLPMKESRSIIHNNLPFLTDHTEDKERNLLAQENNAQNIKNNIPKDNNVQNNVAYFSTMGSLASNNPRDIANQERVTTVLIMIHGSGRTAEDYLYGAVSSLPTDQQNPTNATMMVLSPWFLDPEDDKYNHNNNQEDNDNGNYGFNQEDKNILLQEDELINRHDNIPIPLPPNTLRWIEEGPVLEHTWRYGAQAINSSISSFDAIDRLVETLVVGNGRLQFPALQRILVAGHSAGGQFVQRWALLSNSPAWKANKEVEIRVIPANPRCFAFLDDRRFVNTTTTNNNDDEGTTSTQEFRRPDDDVIASCPDYNEWIWGLDKGGIAAPYKDQAIANAGGVKSLTYRYVTQRRLVYLAGGEDLQVFDDDCGSVLQGKTRRERSRAFMASLLEAYPDELEKTKRHNRLVVPGVPHDHCLMFQSPEGQEALFGDDQLVEVDMDDESILLE